MRQYLTIPFLFLSSILLMGLMPIEKDFETRVHALTLYKESIGADPISTEYYFYWAEGKTIKKYRFMITESTDSVRVRLLNDMYFDDKGKLVLYTYWSGKSKYIKRLVRGLDPHFLSEWKCVFRDGKLIQWYENEAPRTNVPAAEWKEQEKYMLHSAAQAIDSWKEILQKKKASRSSSKKGTMK